MIKKYIFQTSIMKKVVINAKYGGFGLSDDAIVMYGELKGLNLKKVKNQFGGYNYYIDDIEDEEHYFSHDEVEREDPFLIQTVETLKEKSFGQCALLKVVEIPEDVKYFIQEYDGFEHIAEVHRTWY